MAYLSNGNSGNNGDIPKIQLESKEDVHFLQAQFTTFLEKTLENNATLRDSQMTAEQRREAEELIKDRLLKWTNDMWELAGHSITVNGFGYHEAMKEKSRIEPLNEQLKSEVEQLQEEADSLLLSVSSKRRTVPAQIERLARDSVWRESVAAERTVEIKGEAAAAGAAASEQTLPYIDDRVNSDLEQALKLAQKVNDEVQGTVEALKQTTEAMKDTKARAAAEAQDDCKVREILLPKKPTLLHSTQGTSENLQLLAYKTALHAITSEAASSISVGDMTVEQLRAHIEQLYNLPASSQKLLHKGQILRAEGSLVSAIVPPNGKVLLIGTPRAELAKFQEQMTRRQQGQINNAKYRANAASLYRTHDSLGTSDEYGFGSIKTLPISHRRNEAQSMLQKLARDQGVKAIMQKHKYRVGVLQELHPQERTILGYNRNRGQVIALRLRTDDLEGFRDYLNVRRVLMHELAHMVWDEHDENFHRLNRQHCKEVVDLDWSLRGRTVGPAMDYYEPQADDAQNVDGGSLKPSGFILGGTAPHLPADSLESSPNAKRDLAYMAYKKRSSSSS
ncbi:hypothetical protein EV183_005335 [Coemansia sp. RSA 2336]|nr:hypothetical protein EV183_005335 [Coemansia sp. RSA 2336]